MPTFLKISENASLAFHATAVLARHPAQRISAPDLARELGTSPHTLGKVMTLLVRAGLVEGSRGPSGGFLLTKPAADIRLTDVYESVEGPISEGRCLLRRPVCKGRSCIISSLVRQLSDQARDLFDNTSLQTLAGSVEIGDERWSAKRAEPRIAGVARGQSCRASCGA